MEDEEEKSKCTMHRRIVHYVQCIPARCVARANNSNQVSIHSDSDGASQFHYFPSSDSSSASPFSLKCDCVSVFIIHFPFHIHSWPCIRDQLAAGANAWALARLRKKRRRKNDMQKRIQIQMWMSFICVERAHLCICDRTGVPVTPALCDAIYKIRIVIVFTCARVSTRNLQFKRNAYRVRLLPNKMRKTKTRCDIECVRICKFMLTDWHDSELNGFDWQECCEHDCECTQANHSNGFSAPIAPIQCTKSRHCCRWKIYVRRTHRELDDYASTVAILQSLLIDDPNQITIQSIFTFYPMENEHTSPVWKIKFRLIVWICSTDASSRLLMLFHSRVWSCMIYVKPFSIEWVKVRRYQSGAFKLMERILEWRQFFVCNFSWICNFFMGISLPYCRGP